MRGWVCLLSVVVAGVFRKVKIREGEVKGRKKNSGDGTYEVV